MIHLEASSADGGSIRQAERTSIRDFLTKWLPEVPGPILDFGCGAQPYRNLVESFGLGYTGYDRTEFPASCASEDIGETPSGEFGTVMCTQVIQYVPDPISFLGCDIGDLVREDGYLLLTYPTAWAEVEPEDLWRFTRAGMEHLVREAGFEIVAHELRATVSLGEFVFPLGYGLVAQG